MSLYTPLIEKIVLPLSDILLKRTITKHLNFLMDSQWWSENDLIEYQNSQLKKLIHHAYENVPYYHDLLKTNKLTPNDIRTKHDLYKIPILTKEDIRKNFPDRIAAKNYPKKLIYQGNSSGSTGKPIQYLISKDSYSYNIACNLRGWYWMGYKMGDKFVKISVNERPVEKRIQDIILRTKYITHSFTENDFSNVIFEFEKFRPKIIRSFPDPIFFIAKYMEQKGIKHIRPKIITTTGNMLLPHVRNLIESQFGCKIFDSYRCEGGPNAFENPTHETYISSMEYGIAEIVLNGEEVKPGEKGRYVCTDLQNYAMPFIRYDSGDVVVKGKEKCKSGRQHLTIDRIEGRDSDILITPDNTYLIVHHFTGYFEFFKSVDQFQIIQEEMDHFIIYLVVNKFFTTKTKEEIQNHWQAIMGKTVKLEIKIVEEIKIPPSGKRRFLIRNESIKLPF